MKAKDYLIKCNQICDDIGDCNKCPLSKHACGIPVRKDIDVIVEMVENFEEIYFPFGRCQKCKKEFNSELMQEYEITHCPWCGQSI